LGNNKVLGSRILYGLLLTVL